MSAGMSAYAEELARRLPRVAPDLRFATLVRHSALDADEQIGLPLRLRRARPRLVHHLSLYAPFFGWQPTIVTVHDLIHLRYPRFFKRRVGPYYATVVRGVCARAARVITDDERTIADLERYLGVAPAKVDVIPLGVDDRFLEAGERAAAAPTVRSQNGTVPYFLYVGNHRPHKDLPTLLTAWATLPEHERVDLRLTGMDDLEPAARPARTSGALRFVGEVEPAKLPPLYANAVALVYPSLCEGFGLPLLEAAACGTPVIACADAIPGVLRAHVTAFAAHDVTGLRAHMLAALARQSDREPARRVARGLTWDACAERTAEVYRRVLADGPVR